MHLTDVSRSRVWGLLVALAILCLCVAVWVFLSGNSQKPFVFDEFYGLLD
jgi:hypothetical protein